MGRNLALRARVDAEEEGEEREHHHHAGGAAHLSGSDISGTVTVVIYVCYDAEFT